MIDGPTGTMVALKFGDVFPEGDLVGEWLATLAMAFNDIAYVHRHLDDTYADRPAYEYFYFLRLAIGHFNEGAGLLEASESVAEIGSYAASLDATVQALHADCLQRYRGQKGVIAQVRNHSAFHYPALEPLNQRRVMRRALASLAEEHGWLYKAPTGTIRDSRLLFADDIESVLFQRSTPTDADLYAAHEEIKTAMSSFMRFVNAALDEWWARAIRRGVAFPSRPGEPPSYGKLIERSRGDENGGKSP